MGLVGAFFGGWDPVRDLPFNAQTSYSHDFSGKPAPFINEFHGATQNDKGQLVTVIVSCYLAASKHRNIDFARNELMDAKRLICIDCYGIR